MVGEINKKILCNQKGQAVFELVIFLPFLIFLYTIYYTTGNSINGSINQQKAVRGYFYSTTLGNSYLNTKLDLDSLVSRKIRTVGFSALGWREKGGVGADGETAFGNCFSFSSVLNNGSTETCDSAEREEDKDGNVLSRHIRVFTYYGVCGPVYKMNDQTNVYEYDPALQGEGNTCVMRY